MGNDSAHSPEDSTIAGHSPSTGITTPDLSPRRNRDSATGDGREGPGDDSDDIWMSDTDLDPATASDTTTASTVRHETLSDVPSIRRQHMTDGYREGLSVGKARVMQQGFDDGYPIGVTIALRAGTVLGVLEGCLASYGRDKASGAATLTTNTSADFTVPDSGGGKGAVWSETAQGERSKNPRAELERAYQQAKEELAISSLMASLTDRDVADAKSNAESRSLPAVVDRVLRKWETVVFGTAHQQIHEASHAAAATDG